MLPDLTAPPPPRRLLVTTDAVGGVWRYALDLGRGLVERRMQPVLAVLGPPPSPRQEAEAAASGLTVIVTDEPLDWTADDAAAVGAAQRSLEALATDLGCDAVHLHTPALAAFGRWRVPCVAVSHSCVATWWRAVRGGSELPDDFRWRTRLVASGLENADAVVAPSEAHADAVRTTYGLPTPPLVVHNGRQAPPRAARAVRRRQLLTVGRLWDEAKGVTDLARFAAGAGVPVRAAGPLRGPHGVSAHVEGVQPLGVLDDDGLADEYAACGAFVSLARYEPFGLAVLEAALAEAPLVLSDIPTFRELWDGAALFVAPGDDRALAAAVDAAFAETGWGTKARARAARYPLDAMVERTLATHRRVAAARTGHTVPA